MARHLITSALPYINGVKHLGNLVGSMLPADVSARFFRAAGHEVLAICATDEHGTPAELAAAAEGMSVADYCDRYHDVQRRLGEQFLLSWDWFGRTSRPQNHELTNHLASRLKAEGFLEIRATEQVYSIADQRFLPDRYVIGTCPNCGYERARGDQCENCGKQLDPTDLIDARSAISGSSALEVRESNHVFLRQSLLSERIRAWVDAQVEWPQLTRSIAYKWLDEGLRDRGITRDLTWGIPVDPVEFPEVAGKVWYVWFDAPIGYIAATKEWADADPSGGRDWQRWWRLDRGADDVRYTEFMGKDNVPFHTLSFPGTLLGSGEPWKLVDQLKSFNWLTYYGGKFSTSEGRGVFMDQALDLLPADCWRWFLMSNAPENDDANFTWDLVGEAVNKDLVATLGNFVNRTTTQISRHFGDAVPDTGEPAEPEFEFVARVRSALSAYLDHMERLEFRKATAALRAVWSEGNTYLEQREPWRAIKTDRDAAAVTLRTAVGFARLVASASSPYLPETADRIAQMLPDDRLDAPLSPELADSILEVSGGTRFVAPGLLFGKLDDEQLAAWTERFAGAG